MANPEVQHAAAVRMPVEKRIVALDLQQQDVVMVLNWGALPTAAITQDLMNRHAEKAGLPFPVWSFPMIPPFKICNIAARDMIQRGFIVDCQISDGVVDRVAQVSWHLVRIS